MMKKEKNKGKMLKNVLKKSSKESKGITLIALVITIIVLLILAGITMASVTGENGILKKATDAKGATEKAALVEEAKTEILNMQAENKTGDFNSTDLKSVLEKYFDNVPNAYDINADTKLIAKKEYGGYELKVSDIYNETISNATTYTVYEDENKEKAPVPEGFTVSSKSTENTVKNGLVISDNKGNEYVWIPCTTNESSDKLKYQRTEWYVEVDGDDNSRASKDEQTLTDSDVTYSDADTKYGITAEISKEIVAQIKAEKESISKYGGYYIGRYETGKSGETAVIKAEQEPYASLLWSKAYSLAKGIGGGTGATTYLCSSYAWDTAVNFIQNNGAKNYATSISGFNGNWNGQQVVKDGEVIKKADEQKRLNTGLTTAWSNIYDMGGNVGEYTTEINPGTSETVVLRGGGYYNTGAAGGRWDGYSGLAYYIYGFRATLFLK